VKILEWLFARGWAVGGAAAGAAVAVFTRPPYLLVDQGWFQPAVFGATSVCMMLVAWQPWKVGLRALAIGLMALAAGSRAWGLMFVGEGPFEARAIGTTAWLLVGYYTFLLGLLTLRAGKRAHGE
jgi:hypothetical protein